MDNISELIQLSGNKNNENISADEVSSASDLSMNVEIVTTKHDFENLEQAWNKLLNESEVKAHIFQTFDWQWLWWKHFGGNNHLYIIAVRKGEDLIGLAPFYIEKKSILGFYEHTKLKFIGANIPDNNAVGGFTSYSISDYLDIVVHPDYRKAVVKTFIRYLDENRYLVDQIELNELPGDGAFIGDVLPEIRERGWKFSKKKRELCPQIQLPGSIGQYLDQLHRKARYKLRYCKRAVTEKELFRVKRIESLSELESSFKNFVRIHQKRWNRQGYPGIFANNQYRIFLKDVGRAFVQSGRLKMSTAIDNDDRCIAVDFAFQFKGRIYDYQKAFDDKTDLAKYSPGKALTYFLIEDAIADKKECVDLLRGGEKYKFRFTNDTTRNWTVTIPGLGKKHLKKNLLRVTNISNDIKEQLRREWLLIRVHFKQWGLSGFFTRYTGFLKDRIADKF